MKGIQLQKKWQRRDLNLRPRAYEALDWPRVLNRFFEFTSVSKFSLFSKFNKGYISQVKSGYRPPSARFIDAIEEFFYDTRTERAYLNQFLASREVMEVTPATMTYYQNKLSRFLWEVHADQSTRQDIEEFLQQFKTPGNRHAYYRVIKTFYNWREEIYDDPSPVEKLKAPRLGKPILPTLTAEQVAQLIDAVVSNRDKAIIAMFTESGLRLNELVNVQPGDIDWKNGTVQVLGKGRKEALAPRGKLTQKYLNELLKDGITRQSKDGITAQSIDCITGQSTDGITGQSIDCITGQSTDGITAHSIDCITRQLSGNPTENIWHINKWGIISMF